MKKKLSEMTDKELRDYILESRGEMRTILDAAEKEERELTADEQSKFDELKRSAEVAEARQIANLRPLPIKDEDEKKEVRKIYDIFGENLRNAVTNGGKAKIEVRTNVNIDSTDVADTIPVLFQDVIDALTPALIIEKAGSKMLFNVQGQPTWPTVGDVEASWAGENVSLVDKDINFDAIRATPHRMGLKIKVSRRALEQSNLNLYNLVVNKIARSFAALLNKTMVSLTAVAQDAPTGVFVAAALDAVTLSATPTFKEVVSLETEVMAHNIELDADGFGAYIISTAMRGKLKTTPIEAGETKMILEGDLMNGYPVIVSNYMDANSIGFGFFEYSVVSQFGDFNLIFDPITGAGENEVKFVGNTEVDITLLRPEAFVIGQIPQTT
jgi:HK97 family phage major capsid protein